MLADSKIMGFIFTHDYDKARAFYEGKLGFQFISQDQFALAVRAGAHMIRITKMTDFQPARATVLAKLAKPSKQEQATMAELVGAAETGSISLTRAVRLALAMAHKPLTPVAIRDRLVERGFELSSYSNPMAAIHSAVNRMIAVAEITAASGEGERPAYSAVKGVVRPVVVKDRAELKKALDLLAGKSEERTQS